MITALVELKAKLAKLPSMIPIFLAEIFREIASAVEDEVIRQLQAGQRGDGTYLPDYSPVSVEVFGKHPGPMTLEDTGAFYRGIMLEVVEAGIRIYGKDIKTDMLELHYGEEILDLSEESLENLRRDYVIELLQEKILKYLAA